MSLSKIQTLASLRPKLASYRRSRKKIVFTNGCFDILHAGHVRYLKKAKSLGGVLVVGLNADASVRKLKGPGRPLHSQKDRAEVLAALEAVDVVVSFPEQTPLELIRVVRPDFLVKGGDWKGRDIVGGAFVRSYGGKVRSLPYSEGFSTTGILEKIGGS